MQQAFPFGGICPLFSSTHSPPDINPMSTRYQPVGIYPEENECFGLFFAFMCKEKVKRHYALCIRELLTPSFFLQEFAFLFN
ncbi:MAG: hypothetical protein MJZ60_02990, partial [Bacteroidaceae bacterium]|nr:hypothetical protein [Bacteroidaceae bacterium]